MDQLRTEEKQSLEDSSIIDHLIQTFGTVTPVTPSAPITVERVEPTKIYDQIRRTVTQHWEYDHRIFPKVD